MKATIKDVAKYAGVSVATVSRYLNNSPLIAEASVEKVRNAIEALDYQPSMMARGLLHGNSKTIALAVDYDDSETYGNDYFLRIQYGLEHELSKNGYYLMICHIGGENGTATLRALINENRIDGLVLLSGLARGEVMSVVKESPIPCVIAGRCDDPDSVWVDIDNISAGKLAAERLLASDPRTVGFLANSFDKVFVSERFSGYCNALKEHGMEIDKAYVSDGLTDSKSFSEYVRYNFSNLCDAYVVSDSTIGFFFMRELVKRGIRIPDEVQVIGFDDSILAAAADPAMTVVEIDVTNLGKSAAKLLIAQLQDETLCPGQNLLPARIINRTSTK